MGVAPVMIGRNPGLGAETTILFLALQNIRNCVLQMRLQLCCWLPVSQSGLRREMWHADDPICATDGPVVWVLYTRHIDDRIGEI